ncbi:NAD-dependent epimerase/dehydratase family protein [Gracilibacillus marinus]|uniref:NAD-dependent epimerase/dehydratase family protein n=1 Tax=Gracilibacillus marinus TaxID=630535 RepID=A0ABV8VQM0_9BACI
MQKKVVIIGGAGTIGIKLYEGLHHLYSIQLLDKLTHHHLEIIQVDATNYEKLSQQIPQNTDVLINLLRIETTDAVEDIDTFHDMTEVFFKASYYILDIATKYQIPKVIFASSNHVTDYYEQNGYSTLKREIKTTDYPAPKGLYGVLKMASELTGFIFMLHHNLSVINIRIGSVPNEPKSNDRLKRTILHEADLIQLFQKAIESDQQYGTYYGVSNNVDKPWDIANAIEELGYRPME